MKKEIKDVYKTMKPDEEAKERMLNNIRTLALQKTEFQDSLNMLENTQDNEDFIGKEEMRKANVKHIMRVAAVLAVVLILPTAAYATRLFGLQEISLGKKTLEIPATEDDMGVTQDTPAMEEQEADMISLQGVADSPEFKACSEWMEFEETYDADGSILGQIGNESTGLSEEYNAYLCYTQEMADKIDEICAKYSLTKLAGFEAADNYNSLCGRAGIGDIFGNLPPNGRNQIYGGYSYSDGTFLLEGMAVITGEHECITDYQLTRSVKGSFHTTILNVGDIHAYEQWEYTTEHGETVLLALSSTKALLIAEREHSFITVNFLGNIDGTFDISNRALEQLAEIFDVSVIP